MQTNPNTKFKARPDVVSSDLADGAALLDLRASVYYTVNAVGLHVWRTLQEPAALAEVVLSVSGAFNTTEAACADDVRTMIDKLVSADLVETVED